MGHSGKAKLVPSVFALEQIPGTSRRANTLGTMLGQSELNKKWR